VTTDWNDRALATDFDELEGLTERAVGFPILFRELSLASAGVTHLLDYGCGSGKTARIAAERYGVRITAVDTSAEMLRIAARERSHPLVRYRLIDGERVSFLADGTVDAAMSCFVFINIADLAEIREIAGEVARVLRPGGSYVIMDSNPEATGIRFSTFRTGDPGRIYETGEPRRVELYGTGNSVLELTDYHWPATTYRHVLGDAGFRRTRIHTPRLTTAGRDYGAHPYDTELRVEATHPPLLIVSAEK